MRQSLFVLSACLAVASIACSDSHRTKRPDRVAPSVATREPMMDDIVPVVGGDAYAVGLPHGIWYLHAGTATTVHAIGDSAVRARFTSMLSAEVQPTSDGGAYAFGLIGGIWRLRADTAFPVVFGVKDSLAGVSRVSREEDLSFALSAHARRAHKSPDESSSP